MKRPTRGPRPADRPARRGMQRRLRLEGLEDRRLLAGLQVTTVNDDGPGSLRQAILGANGSLDPAQFSITFAIPGSNVHVIALASPLPPITHPTLIDGYSQLLASKNSQAVGDNAVPMIELDGTGAGGDGLAVAATNTIIQGLVVDHFTAGAGISVGAGGDGAIIRGSFIGVDASGAAAAGNAVGVSVVGASNVTIGGGTPSARNVIAGNASLNVNVGSAAGTGTDNEVIEGNLIGTDAAGTAAPTGAATGISDVVLLGSSGNNIGGPSYALGNVISGTGTGGDGIEIVPGKNDLGSGNFLYGNLIGTTASGEAPLPNGVGVAVSTQNNRIGGASAGNVISANLGDAITLEPPAANVTSTGNFVENNSIGSDLMRTATNLGNGGRGVYVTSSNNQIGIPPGDGNSIVNNTGAGVQVDMGASGNAIRGNSIAGNAGSGIDIASTPPDPADNSNQPAPVLTSAVGAGSRTNVDGTLTAAPGTAYILDFFSSPATTPIGSVQGQTFLGSATVMTDATGKVSFVSFAPAAALPGQYVTATATDPIGNSSGFSAPVVAAAPAGPAADLSVSLSAPAAVSEGKPFTYTIVVSNIGPADATNVLLSDALPAGLSNVSYAINNGPGTPVADGPLSIPMGTVTAHNPATVTITATPTAPTSPPAIQIANSVSVSADESDPTPNDTKASDLVTVNPPADLAVTLDAPATAVLNSSFTYALTVQNDGPGAATGVSVTDTLPAGLTFVSASASAGSFSRTGNTLTFAVGGLAANDSANLSILVMPVALGRITDTDGVIGDQLDPVAGNNSGSATITILPPPPQLSVSLEAVPAPVTVGQTLTYTLDVTNTGGVPATDVMLTDTLPATEGATFVSAMTSPAGPAPTVANNILTAALGTIAAGGHATLTIRVTPTAPGTVTDSATANSDQTVSTPSTFLTTAVDSAPPSLSIVVSSPTPAPTAGAPLKYLLTVTNTGLGDATNAVVTDALPAGLAYQSATSTLGGDPTVSHGVVTASLGTLPAGGTATITITVTPSAAGTVLNSATVTDDETAPVVATPLSITAAPEPADLTITISPSAHPAIGQPLTYLVTVNNAGPAVATDVVLTDTLPAGLTYTSSHSSKGGAPLQAGGVVQVDFGSIAAGTSATLTIVASPGPGASGNPLVDTARANDPEPDETPSNRAQTNTISISPPAHLVLGIAPTPTSPLVNQAVTYTLSVTNAGPADATGVVGTDTLPAGATFKSASTGAIPANGKVALALGTIPSGQTRTATFVVIPAAIGGLTDSATVAADQFDPPPLDNSATSAISVGQASALHIDASVVGVAANAGIALITVDRTGGSSGTVTVPYQTHDGTALAGTHYVATSGTLTFNPGQMSQSFGVPILDPHQVQGLTSFTVTLGAPTGGASLTAPQAETVTITNTDVPGNVQFAATTLRVNQAAGTATLALTRTNGSDVPFTVAYATGDGTAHAGVDYAGTSGSVTFAVGQTAATFTIPLIDRGPAGHAPRTFNLTLSDPTSDVALGTQATAAVTIMGPTVAGDYEGTGRANPSAFDAKTSTFLIVPAAGGTAIATQLGYPGHGNVPLSGDYDGDGVTDIGYFDPTSSTFVAIPSAGGVALIQQFGYLGHGNIPLTGDFYGNHRTDIGIFDPTSSTFAILPNGPGLAIVRPLGNPAHHDIPIVGDYFGDGRDALGVYDPVTSTFLIRETGGNRQINLQFGNASDHLIPLVGDYTGDGKADIGYYDPTSSYFVVIPSQGGRVILTKFGDPTHHLVPLSGSYDGTGRADIGYYDPSTATLAYLPTGSTLAVTRTIGTHTHPLVPLPALLPAASPGLAAQALPEVLLATALDHVLAKK